MTEPAIANALLEAVADPVLLVNLDGSILGANRAATRITGYSMQELESIPATRVLVDDPIAAKDATTPRKSCWLATKDGTLIPIAVSGSPIGDRGAIVGIVFVARDLRDILRIAAERDAAEQRLVRLRDQLVIAEREALVGTIACGVGHELRNLAQVLVAVADVIEHSVVADEVVRHALRDLERASEHVGSHGTRLMTLARPGDDHPAPTSLRSMLDDVLSMLRATGRLRGISVEVDVGDDLGLFVNRVRIEQVLVNLLANAADAISVPGCIAIRASARAARMHVEVTDTGAGMSAAVISRIFEPFFTTKSAGTGLGLVIVREIVEGYGGHLAVDSTVGSGTTFRLDLPLHRESKQ